TVVMWPLGSIRRTRCNVESAMTSDPSRPTARPEGVPSKAWLAGPPSPHAWVGAGHVRPEVPARISASPLTFLTVASSRLMRYAVLSDSVVDQVGGVVGTRLSSLPERSLVSNNFEVRVG